MWLPHGSPERVGATNSLQCIDGSVQVEIVCERGNV